jgi:hypothetical protein
MTKTAKFSNGQTRIYSGSVSTIAWMITIGDKVQKIGLSRNMETAEKSSRSYITNGIDLYYGNFPEDVRDEVKFVDTKYDYTSIDSRGYARGSLGSHPPPEKGLPHEIQAKHIPRC